MNVGDSRIPFIPFHEVVEKGEHRGLRRRLHKDIITRIGWDVLRIP